MKKKAPLTQIPLIFSEKADTLDWAGEPLLALELRWPEGGDGCPRKLARLLALSPTVWAARWQGVVFHQAHAALTACRERSRPFTPWVCSLEAQVTHNKDGLLCVVWTAAEQCGESRRSTLRYTLVWDWNENAVRTLASFFPGEHRWRRAVLRRITAEAQRRLDSGESLLDRDLSGLRRYFSPRRFQLTEGRLEAFYPLCAVGGYAEGIPAFPIGELPSADTPAEP